MTRIPPANHADAVLVHDPTITLRILVSPLGYCETRDTHYDADADGSVEVREVPSDVVL